MNDFLSTSNALGYKIRAQIVGQYHFLQPTWAPTYSCYQWQEHKLLNKESITPTNVLEFLQIILIVTSFLSSAGKPSKWSENIAITEIIHVQQHPVCCRATGPFHAA